MNRFLRLLLAASCSVSTLAWAQQPSAPVEAAVRGLLERETAGLPGEIELEVGVLDPANQLPPCAAPEAFLPSGALAWGQLSVGVRCTAPATWTVYLPARVKVVADYVVARQGLRPGQTIGPGDIALERGDLAAQSGKVLSDPARAIGVRTSRGIAAGTPLREEHLRLPPAVESGQTVKIIGTGNGFSVGGEGRALGRAADGENVRVRLPNGSIVSGIARAGGVVELRF
ncbi:MAG: flagellar basal body P-ring formation protein FlgA [Pseudazoarcus pumilus]|nr:flagellar basal body P-ring formation protein FlgA [Pseudazoarcus pumilus]